jgi:aspartyl-tRNA synthetase
MAFGVDRLAALLCGVGPIRDVMAFPKTQKGTDQMSSTPSPVRPEQLAELGVAVIKVPKA